MAVRKEMGAEFREHMRGGNGTVELHGIMKEPEFFGMGRMFSRIVLKPGSSIGWHEHLGEAEYFYILSGNGVFTDSDKQEIKVGPGDFCSIEPDSGHAIANGGDTDLELLALILYTKQK